MDRTVFARIGAVCYVLWGLLHYNAALSVSQLGLAIAPSMVQGRLYQDAFYLVAVATSGIALAIKLNWHNSRDGFWLTALILGIGDIPFIVFVLGPGYVDLWPGIQGPALWILGMIFTGLGQLRSAPAARATT